MVYFSAPPTPPKVNEKSLSKQILDMPMGEAGGAAFTVRDFLEAASHPMNNDPRRAEAEALLTTLTRLSVGAPIQQGTLSASIGAVHNLAQASARDASRFAPDPVAAAYIDRGGQGYDQSHETYAQYASTARALEGLTGPLNAMAQLHQQASRGRTV